MLLYVSIFLFFRSLGLIFLQKTHFLSVLLILEIITLRLFIIIVVTIGTGNRISNVRFRLVFLVFGVYEAANGLGLLVRRTRSTGVDQLRGLFRLRF